MTTFTVSTHTVVKRLFVESMIPAEANLDERDLAIFEAGFNAAKKLLHKQLTFDNTEFLRRLPSKPKTQ